MTGAKLYLIIFLTLAISSMAIGVAYPQSETDIVINDDYSGNDQNSPGLTVSNSGNIMIVWTDKRYGDSYIFCQMLDSGGTTLGYNQQVNDDYNAIPHLEPAIASRSDEFFTTWKDYRNGDYPYAPDIYFAAVDSTAPGANQIVTVNPPDLLCESPDIGVLRNGNCIIVWSDYRYNHWDIIGQRMTGDGQLIGNFFRINNDVGKNQQHSPRVAVLPDGGFVVVWYDNRNGDDDIYFQRFDSAAAVIGQNILVTTDNTKTKQAFPAIAADGNGRFFIAWVDWINGVYPQNPDIYLKRYDSSGTAIGSAKRVNSNDYGRAQKQVNLCSDNIGNICVVWADSNYGQWDAYAQIYNPNGIATGGNFRIHSDTTGKQLQPDVTADGYKFYFVWADSRSGDFDIYAGIKQYNEPALVPDPNNVELSMYSGGSLPTPVMVTIDNAGYGALNWAASPDADWIGVSPSTGVTPDTMEISITTNMLLYGTYYAGIRLIDTDHNDSSQIINVTLHVIEPITEISPDTVQFFNTNAAPLGIGVMPVYIYLIDSVSGGYIPIGYDTSTAVLDSIIVNPLSLPSFVDCYANVTSIGTGEFGFRIKQSMINDSIIMPGNYHIANLFFTAGDVEVYNTVDTVFSDSSVTYILGSDLVKRVPTIVAGNLIIGEPTSIDGNDDAGIIPEQPALRQNYPNPFNASTSIELSLPRAMVVSIDIYNILGQRVYIVHDGNLSHGNHKLSWDSQLQNGIPAPSGIYFCRMAAGNKSLVRKMILLR